ncbi:Mss4-like protein [Lentinula raphanica]|uniref:Mss4-like protein n=1 Tax=Lentinula raphanica TaxID=153919 RepID=A0AA38PB50_9AGAR|nr:Mss4-like protein [Lentinula raphanica]KAJ3839361.1 Mss4-like protein [Lentinula raphanica]
MSTAIATTHPATSKDTVRNGSCLCGAITFTVKGDPVHYLVCHCKNCQKASGSAFMMNIWFKDESFKLLTGQDALKPYEDKDTNTGKPLTRYFCSNCGSNVFFRMSPDLPRSDVYLVHGPAIEGSEVWAPRKESFPSNRIPWVTHLETRPKESKAKL